MNLEPEAGSVEVRELTPPGRGAVSVLEVRGTGAVRRLSALLDRAMPDVGRFRLAQLRLAGGMTDEVLVLAREAYAYELHLHGSPLLVRAAIHELSPAKSSVREPHSIEDMAADHLCEAPSEAAARMLLDQAEGALRRELEALVTFDVGAARERIAELERRGRIAARLVLPPTVVLAGPVNAGKSTLLNLMVGEERGVVSAEPGTTRDALLHRGLLGAYAIDWVDTAGLRTLSGTEALAGVEREGQLLGAEVARNADLVLWLCPDPLVPDPPAPARCWIRITSQADRLSADAAAAAPFPISALRDPEAARLTVTHAVQGALHLPPDPWRAGDGVPFTPEVLDAVRDLAGLTAEEREAAVRRILACDFDTLDGANVDPRATSP